MSKCNCGTRIVVKQEFYEYCFLHPVALTKWLRQLRKRILIHTKLWINRKIFAWISSKMAYDKLPIDLNRSWKCSFVIVQKKTGADETLCFFFSYLSGFTFSNSSGTSTDSNIFVMFFCCFAVVCSYACKPARLLWPVFSWINFSGTLDAKRRDADVALREWLVKFVERLPFSNIFYIIVRKVFTQIGTLAYHTFSGSMGIFDKGQR